MHSSVWHARKYLTVALAGAAMTAGLSVTPAVAAHATPATVVALPPAATAGRGATVPFTEYEAENATTNAMRVGPDRTYNTVAAEASGRQAVSLHGAGQYVSFTLAKAANAVTVRYSVPDTADGKGADSTLGVYAAGQRLASLATTSRFSWYYGDYPFTNVPSQGSAHHFFDETRVLLPRTLPAGTEVKLQVGDQDKAASYTIDLADFENVPAPLPRPAGSLSVVDFGADPTGAADSTNAFDAALTQAQTSGKPLWVPPGTFLISRQLVVDQVTVTGAGQWFSVLTGDNVGFAGKSGAAGGSSHVFISSLALLGTVHVRDDSDPVQGLGGVLSDSVISDLWIQHSKVGAWIDGPTDNLRLTGLRILDEAADGVNFHQGVTNSVVENSFLRNTGDDGLAMWTDHVNDANDTFRHNTVLTPVLANNIAVYGGKDNSVVDNVVADTVTQGGGIHVGNRFGSLPLSGTTTIARNTTVRAGSLSLDWFTGLGALWFWAADAPMTGALRVSDMVLLDSTFEAIQTYGSSVSNLTFERVAIGGAGTFALQLESAGSGRFTNVVAAGLGAGGTYDCNSGFVITRTGVNIGWLDRTCGFPPGGPLTVTPGTLDFGHVTVGTPGPTRTLTVTNPTGHAVVIQSVTTWGQFTITASTCGATLGAGQSCTVTVAFTPFKAGVHAGTLTISTPGSASQQLVPLTGDGLSASGDAAAGRPVTASATGYGSAQALTDGNPGSIWEGPKGAAAFPVSITVDTQNVQPIGRVVLQLPDCPCWGIRTQTISVDGSTDGTTWTPLVAARPVTFDALNAHNTNTLTFGQHSVRYVRVTFTSTTDTGGAAQLGEIQLYATGVGPSANGDFAQGKPATSPDTSYGNANDVTDSDRNTLWEGNLPATLTIDTLSVQTVGRVVLQLPSCGCWGVRTEVLSVAGSTDGVTWTPLVSNRSVVFDGPNADNTAQVTFAPTDLRYVRITITSNTGGNAQLSEVHVYAASDNVALGNPVSASATGYGNAATLTDGSQETLWEGVPGSYPVSVTVDLQSAQTVGRAVLQLPSCACWGTRVEDVDIQGSTDGTTWTPLAATAPVTFDAVSAHNTATVTFAAATARYVRVTVHSNTGSTAAQLAELQLYAG